MTGPFVLLDDQRPGGRARLYRDPRAIITAHDSREVRPALDELRRATRSGLNAAGYLAYGAGAALEPKLAPADPGGMPLLWFGLFERWTTPDLRDLLPDPAGAATGPIAPRITYEAYRAAFATVQAAIAAGDIYQANLTFPAELQVAGDPLALYARLRGQAAAGWSGVIFDGARWLLSCSPELFFTAKQGRLTARPMKGTAARDPDPATDAANAATLAADPKQRAENLMIVDLLRNDLSRVAAAGSVVVPDLFTVETYPTIHQLTSTVTGTLADGRDAVDVLAATFPCGSITGAPKLRAMEIIAEVEPHPRGIYTGSIGRIDAGGDAAFNVAIRTLRIEGDRNIATIGLGSGVVADSNADAEWAECLVKGSFVAAGERPFDLIETMRFDPLEGLCDLQRHLARLKASAEALGFALDRHAVRNELQAATFRLRTASRVRLMLARSGAIAIEAGPSPPAPDAPVTAAIAPLPVASADFRLRHKTSERAFYDAPRRAAGTFEVVFEDAGGRLTEGSFTSLFVERGDRLLTPPAALGLLPGILRQRLIEEGRAEEAVLTRADLAGGFLLGNALRGLMPARLATPGG